MFLKTLSLQNFRSYTKADFDFSSNTTIIIGPNTAGKTNLLEAIYFLAKGKSFLAEKDKDVLRFSAQTTHIKGVIVEINDKTTLEILLTSGELIGREAPVKKYLVNGVPKRRADFASLFPVVFFSPSDLAIITDSPSLRRSFLDDVLEQADKTYSLSQATYTKALRQRNALLDRVRETGKRDERLFEYWDSLLIKHGTIITQKREMFIGFVNDSQKDIFPLEVAYDKSIVSHERLLQYKNAEMGAGVTLVGPHRDNFLVFMKDTTGQNREVKFFGSRGQQRLVILQLKLLEIAFLEKTLDARPTLLLDDIFSELDESHIHLVLSMLGKQQTVITTTHKEFIEDTFLRNASVVELG